MVKNDIADEKVGYPAWQNLIALGGAVVVPLRLGQKGSDPSI